MNQRLKARVVGELLGWGHRRTTRWLRDEGVGRQTETGRWFVDLKELAALYPELVLGILDREDDL